MGSFESEPGLGTLTYLCKPGRVPFTIYASLPVGGGGVPGVAGGRRLLSEQYCDIFRQNPLSDET